MARISGIYKIENVKTGDFYIGSSVNIDRRWGQHLWELRNGFHYNTHLQRAWNKYGEESFEFSIIEKAKKKDLQAREQHYIDTLNPKFNINMEAYRPPDWEGRKHTEESKRKMSLSRMGEKNHRWGKRGELNPRYGTSIPDEVKNKISRGLKEYYKHNPHPKGLKGKDNPNYGKKMSEEQKMRLSEMRAGEKNPQWGNLGDACPNSKIRESQVPEIRDLYATGKYTSKEMGDMYGVTSSAIMSIIREERWTHVEGGERNITRRRYPGQKLSEEDVVEIRKLYSSGKMSQKELSKMYGVRSNTISQLVNYKTWKKVK